jgi:hypothetical protein
MLKLRTLKMAHVSILQLPAAIEFAFKVRN